jgi:polysaccharide export outer membrane protein
MKLEVKFRHQTCKGIYHMVLMSWRFFAIFLVICGASVLLAALPPVLAQTKSSNKGLETFSRRVNDLSANAGDFAAGNGVRIKVWRDLTVADQGAVQNLGLNDDFVIDSRGYVTLPIVGEIRAAGHTRKSLAQAVEDSLDVDRIRVMCLPLIRVTLLGAVNRPGSYLVESKDSLWGLIDEAGGPSNGADFRRIFVERSGQIVNRNLLQSFEQGHSLEQIDVRSGDQIHVPNRQTRNYFRTVVDAVTLTASFVLLYFQFSDRSR